MANVLINNQKKEALAKKQEEKMKKIEEAHRGKLKTISQKAQDLNRVLKEHQSVAALDRRRHIKASLKAFRERVQKAKSAEKMVGKVQGPTAKTRDLKEQAGQYEFNAQLNDQDETNRLQSYFIEYEAETEEARNRREARVREQTAAARHKLAKTSEIRLRTKQQEARYADHVSDQLIKKLLRNEENLKAKKLKIRNQVEEEKKRFAETIADKKKKVRTAFKTKQQRVEETAALNEARASKIEENLQKVREEKQARLNEENMRWRECFLRALEIHESNVSS